jgi:nicotinamidase-related amidase
MPMDKTLLLIVDMQKHYLQSPETQAIVPRINRLVGHWKAQNLPVVLSKFYNREGSPWVRFIGSTSMMTAEETDLHPVLKLDYGSILEKGTYSAWSDEILHICHANSIESVAICGVDTDQCVLATALSAFDAGIRPIIVKDCCASGAGDSYHRQALHILERLVGVDQMVESKTFW